MQGADILADEVNELSEHSTSHSKADVEADAIQQARTDLRVPIRRRDLGLARRASSESTLPDMDLGHFNGGDRPDQPMADAPEDNPEVHPARSRAHANQAFQAGRRRPVPRVDTLALFPSFGRIYGSDSDDEEGGWTWEIREESSPPPDLSPFGIDETHLPAPWPTHSICGIGPAGPDRSSPDSARRDSSLPRGLSGRCLPGGLRPPSSDDGDDSDAMSEDGSDYSDAAPMHDAHTQDDGSSPIGSPEIVVRSGPGVHQPSDVWMRDVEQESVIDVVELPSVRLSGDDDTSEAEDPAGGNDGEPSVCGDTIRVRPPGNPHLPGHLEPPHEAQQLDVLNSIEVDSNPEDQGHQDHTHTSSSSRNVKGRRIRRQPSVLRIPPAHRDKYIYLRGWSTWTSSSLGDLVDAALTCTPAGAQRTTISYSQNQVCPKAKWEAETSGGVSYEEMREVFAARRNAVLSCANSQWPIHNMIQLDEEAAAALARRQGGDGVSDEDEDEERVRRLRAKMVYWPFRQRGESSHQDASDGTPPSTAAEAADVAGTSIPRRQEASRSLSASIDAHDPEIDGGFDTATHNTTTSSRPFNPSAILDRLIAGNYTDPLQTVIYAAPSLQAGRKERTNFRGRFPIDMHLETSDHTDTQRV